MREDVGPAAAPRAATTELRGIARLLKSRRRPRKTKARKGTVVRGHKTAEVPRLELAAFGPHCVVCGHPVGKSDGVRIGSGWYCADRARCAAAPPVPYSQRSSLA